jgi:hypothetical protein
MTALEVAEAMGLFVAAGFFFEAGRDIYVWVWERYLGDAD